MLFLQHTLFTKTLANQDKNKQKNKNIYKQFGLSCSVTGNAALLSVADHQGQQSWQSELLAYILVFDIFLLLF